MGRIITSREVTLSLQNSSAHPAAGPARAPEAQAEPAAVLGDGGGDEGRGGLALLAGRKVVEVLLLQHAPHAGALSLLQVSVRPRTAALPTLQVSVGAISGGGGGGGKVTHVGRWSASMRAVVAPPAMRRPATAVADDDEPISPDELERSA